MQSMPKSSNYMPIPELSPYSNDKRYENPKQDFINTLNYMRDRVDLKTPGTLIDVGTANGEFIYYLKKEVPSWTYIGIDTTPEFLEVARSNPFLSTSEFIQGDARSFERKADVITCLGTLPIFPEVEPVLDNFVEQLNEGGWLFLQGFWNPFDVDVIINFHDHSTEAGKGKWRCDFNTHSQTRIREHLGDRVKNLEFTQMPFEIDLPRREGAPHCNVFTKDLKDGSKMITSGLNLILNSYMLMCQKK